MYYAEAATPHGLYISISKPYLLWIMQRLPLRMACTLILASLTYYVLCRGCHSAWPVHKY